MAAAVTTGLCQLLTRAPGCDCALPPVLCLTKVKYMCPVGVEVESMALGWTAEQRLRRRRRTRAGGWEKKTKNGADEQQLVALRSKLRAKSAADVFAPKHSGP